MSWKVAAAALALVSIAGAQRMSAQAKPGGSDTAPHVLNVRAADVKWEKIFPELGARSSEIAILRVDPKTQATHLMIKVPPHFHVPLHWHTANETHTVVSGTFVIECEGKREVLEAGSYNYVPSKMAHEAWTTTREGAVLFITVDGAWDINWVNGTPTEKDLFADAPQ